MESAKGLCNAVDESLQATGNTFIGENGSNVRPGDWLTILGLLKVVPYWQ